MSRIGYFLVVGLLGAGITCGIPAQSQSPIATVQPEVKSAPPTPIAEKKAELGDDQTWQPDWDMIVEKSLPPEFLSPRRGHAAKALCPRFRVMSDADKRAFWAYFFQALAGAEAGLKPTADVRHDDPQVAVVDTVTKRIVRQEGLLQLTYMDAERYGCDFDWDADKELPEHDPGKTILQPKNNLECGIKILDNQLMSHHKPILTNSSYWVTLRPGTLSYLLFMKQMKNVPQSCGPTPIRHGWFSRTKLPPESEAQNEAPASAALETQKTPTNAAAASAPAAHQAATNPQTASPQPATAAAAGTGAEAAAANH